MNNKQKNHILSAIFSSIFDPVAIYRVIGGPGKGPIDLVYENVNDAYRKAIHFSGGDPIGRKYTEVWYGEEPKDWEEMMLFVASTGQSRYYEGTSNMTPGYFQQFAFSPVQGHVVSLFRDMSEWHKSEINLIKKQKLLRKLTTRLTLAEEKTRRNIANTLHDRVGYSMVRMLNNLRLLCETAENPDAKKLIAETIIEMKKLIDDTRSFTFEISPPLLYEVGLDATLKTCCNQMFTSGDIECSFCSEGSVRNLTEETKVLLYQMTHEILLNVIKHSQASTVSVKIRWGAKKVQILVEDNGVGFDQSSEKEVSNVSGMGLFSIRERISAIGGHLNIISEPNCGTTVSLLAPTLSDEKQMGT